MERIGERVQRYYERATTIACTEQTTQQELWSDLRPRGKPRRLEYELLIVRQPVKGHPEGEVRFERTLKKVDGRPARKHEEPGCTDPEAVEDEPLAFLLPAHRPNYRFTMHGMSTANSDAPHMIVDYDQTAGDRLMITWTDGCVRARGARVRGRIWLDRESLDVRRLEDRVAKGFLMVPYNRSLSTVDMLVKVERAESVTEFGLVQFADPEETLLLPQSIETLVVFSGAPSRRTTQRFTEFKRFLAEGRMKVKGVTDGDE